MSTMGQRRVGPFIVVLAVAAACAAPVQVDPPAPVDAVSARVDSRLPDEALDTAVVRVREFRQSSSVTIVAWGAGDPRYGLRTSLRRDGSMVRDYHTLYLSTGYAPITSGTGILLPPRDYVQTVAPAGHALPYNGVFRDAHSCQGGEGCSPAEAFGARVPDDLLRSALDSLTVRLAARGGTDATITVHRGVIVAFLAAVDSVSSALRSR